MATRTARCQALCCGGLEEGIKQQQFVHLHPVTIFLRKNLKTTDRSFRVSI